MGVVKREGKWTLEKKKQGVYAIKSRKQQQAKIITDEYKPEQFSDERMDVMTEVIEVSDFKAAKRAFMDYIKRQERGGGLFGI